MYTLHCSLKLMKIIQRHVYTRTTRIFGIKWIIKKNKGIKALWSPSLIKNVFFFFLYKSKKKNPSAAFLLSDRLNWVCSGFMKAALKFLINRNIKFSWEQMDPYDESSPTVRLWLSFNSQGGKAGNSWLLLGEQSPPPQFTWNIIYTAINIQGWRLEIQLGLRDGWTDRLSAGFELTIKNHNKTRPVFWENIRQWRSHSDCWLQVFLMFLGTEALWILQVWWL